MTNFTATPQAPVLVVAEFGGIAQETATTQALILAVIEETIYAEQTKTPQTPILVVAEAATLTGTRTAQTPTLAVYGEGARENLALRSWGFSLDGNYFWVLHLGMQGTWVYDITADQWYEWRTAGYENWNAEQGLVWNSRIVAGDNQNGILWEIDPETQLDDDFRPITHTVTGILSVDDRQTMVVDGLWITASVGFPTGDNPTFSLRFSDDQGVTWTEMPQVTVDMQAGNYTQEIAFRSLGSFQAPGRVFEITDVGGAVRIDRAYLETH